MEVVYKNKQIKNVCTNLAFAERKYNKRMATLIYQRVNEILAVDSVETMLKYRLGRCHPLKGDRKGQYAVDLIHPFRLIFEIKDKQIQIAKIMEIVNYHD